MSMTSVPRPPNGPTDPIVAMTAAAGVVIPMPALTARPQPRPAPALNLEWRRDLAPHAAALAAVLEGAGQVLGLVVSDEERQQIAWRALGALDPMVCAVARHRARVAFRATVAEAPPPMDLAVAEKAVAAAVAAHEARLEQGRTR